LTIKPFEGDEACLTGDPRLVFQAIAYDLPTAAMLS
jgi:hypothetical protein